MLIDYFYFFDYVYKKKFPEKFQMKKQIENSQSNSGKVFNKITNTIKDLASNPKIVDGYHVAKSGYNLYKTYDAYQKNEIDNFCEKKAIDFISDDTAKAIFSGLGALVPALGTGFLPVIGVTACGFLIAYGLSKL